MSKRFFIFLFTFFLIFVTNAQVENSKWLIGWNLGRATGVGFALKKRIKNSFEIQGVVTPPVFISQWRNHENYRDIIYYSLGLVGQYIITETEKIEVVSYISAHNYKSTTSIGNIRLKAGAGLGAILKTPNLQYTLRIGYGINKDFQNKVTADNPFFTFVDIGVSLMFYIPTKERK